MLFRFPMMCLAAAAFGYAFYAVIESGRRQHRCSPKRLPPPPTLHARMVNAAFSLQ